MNKELKVKDIKELVIPKHISEWLQGIDLPEEIIKKLYKIIEYGAIKHGRGTWLDPDNVSLQDLANLSSISRHNAQGHLGDKVDSESGELHMWSACCRTAFKAVRQERGIDK